MFDTLRKLFRKMDDASKRVETTCPHCKHVNKGQPSFCEECGADIEERMD